MQSTHLNLTQLATFREFSRLGTLTAVADTLGYTPGAVSQHIASLERSLRVKLVEKTGRHLVLTPAGRLLADQAEALLSRERETIWAVAALKSQVTGPLTIGTWGSTAATLLAPIVQRMGARFPGVVVRSKEVDPDAASTEVRRGTVDVAFGLDYADAPLPRHPRISITELYQEEFTVAVAAEPSGPTVAQVDTERLAAMPWILPPPTSQYGRAIQAGFRNRGFEPNVVHEVTDTAASLQLAAAGLGATMATRLMRRMNPSVELRQLSMEDPLSRKIVLLASGGYVPPSVAAFTEVVTDIATRFARDLDEVLDTAEGRSAEE